ncbi:MAG: TM2 domain-containing protein [Candidatus Methanomethyliaceae archaeon]
MLDNMILLKDVTDHERLLFQNEYLTVQRNSTTAILLALFLGDFGAHHFYMRSTGMGILYLLLCWTLIPGIVALVECFFISGRVKRWNDQKAMEMVTKIKALRNQ